MEGWGGVAGADTICNDLATAAGLPGTYLAWIASSTSNDPASRFFRSPWPYKLPTGQIIATDWADLTDGTIAGRIISDEFGAQVFGRQWTAVLSDGRYKDSQDCEGWTVNTNDKLGDNGINVVTDDRWTDFITPFPCDFAPNRLYCFQQ